MRHILPIVFCILVLNPILISQAAVEREASITISTAEPTPMPKLFRTGVFTFAPVLPVYVKDLLLNDLKPGTVEIDIGQIALQDATDTADVLYRLGVMIPQLQEIHAAGGEVVIALTRIPLWLSSNPRALETVEGDVVRKANVSPPKSPEAWSKLVADVARFFQRELKFSPRYKIGWEPDQGSWQGTEQEFFAFYRNSVRGVREGDPAALIGGPSVSALYNARDNAESPMLQRFIQYCGRTPMPELGLKRVPIDFLIWHQFNSNFLTSWDIAAKQSRQWLKESGYPENTEFLIGEWSSWADWPNPKSMEHDQPMLAPYVISTLHAMNRAGIERASFTSLLEQREEEGRQFIGSFGMVTNQYIKKPVYWAFKSLAMLGDKRLPAKSDNLMVVPIAGTSGPNEVSVVIANQTLSDNILTRSVLEGLLGKGYSVGQLQRNFTSLKTINRILRGQEKIEGLRLPAELSASLAAQVGIVQNQMMASDKSNEGPTAINVKFDQLGWKNYSYEIYRIDSGHANPARIHQRIEDTIQKRLLEEKGRLESGLISRLQQQRYTGESIKYLKTILATQDKAKAMERLPTVERRQVNDMLWITQKYLHERFGNIAQEINAWPEVQMNPVEHAEKVRNVNGVAVKVSMEPNSLLLIKLKRN